MIALLAGAADDGGGDLDHIDFTHFAKRVFAVSNGDEAGVAAGAFGTFFDMTFGASGQMGLRDVDPLLASLDEQVVDDEAKDMILFAHSLSLQQGNMGFAGDRSALPRQAPLPADPPT